MEPHLEKNLYAVILDRGFRELHEEEVGVLNMLESAFY